MPFVLSPSPRRALADARAVLLHYGRYLRGSLTLRSRRKQRLTFAAVFLVLGVALACAPDIDEREAIHVLTYDGTVDPVMEGYIDRGLDEAEDTDARAVILRLDTPGGLVTSMEEIVKDIIASEVPVIVYVTPAGGQAASAGTFITMSGHVAAMAPSTRIGAASPVASGGDDIGGTLEEKIEEDLSALITGIAEERGRNAEWAERAVREAVSANTTEAVEMNIVDFEALTIEPVADQPGRSVIEQADGLTVRVGPTQREVTLDLLDAPVVFNDTTLIEEFLALISDPNIAFLLLSLGATALFIEILNPGLLFPGIFGVIALVVGFFSLGTLPVNWAAVALIVLAFALFVSEVFVSGFGVLGIGGAVSLVLGGLLLTSTSNPDFQVNRWLIFGMAGVLAAFFVMIMGALLQTRRAPAYMGPGALVGQAAVARSRIDPEGLVFLQGSRWKAEAEDAPIEEGETVEVTDVKGLTLRVRKAQEKER